MKKIVLLKTLICLVLINSGKSQVLSHTNETPVKEETQPHVEIDTTEIANRLRQK